MAFLNVLKFPDPKLRQKAKTVTLFDETIKKIISNMFETMYKEEGIGLAAIQVGILQRIIVIDLQNEESTQITLINPKILKQDQEQSYDEGCLSVPGINASIKRAKYIEIEYQNQDGILKKLTATNLLATCIQHEMDHLDGKLFVDYLSAYKRNKIKKELLKLKDK